MAYQYVLLALLAVTTALPVTENVQSVTELIVEKDLKLTEELAALAPGARGIDVVNSINDATAQCLVRSGYAAQFFRIYANGNTDSTGARNAKTYAKYNNAFELFVSPLSSKSGATQASEVQYALRSNSFSVRRIWLQVTSPIYWNSNTNINVGFINDFTRALKNKGITVGIYTNWYDWQQITGNSFAISATDLWYWNTLGAGTAAETSRDFGDFRQFGPFKSWPRAKQYGIAENICGVIANINVFPASNVQEFKSESLPIGQGAFVTKQ